MKINFSNPEFQQLYEEYLDNKKNICDTKTLNECLEKRIFWKIAF